MRGPGGWKALGLFWAALALCAGVTGATLQVLGPPGPVAPAPAPASAAKASARPGTVAAPDPALLEPAGDEPGRMLPRIAADGRMPMAVYAAPVPPAAGPRVALILAGIGLDHAASETAARSLPGAVTFAVSPYGHDLDPVLAAARQTGHEYLLSIPMEPAGAPLNDAGDRALSTRLTPTENLARLRWALSRIAGYVGTTGALGRLLGERFAGDPESLRPVMAELRQRGLLYFDPRAGQGALPLTRGRHIDMVVDATPNAEAIDAQLAELARLARSQGTALGLAGAVRPVTLARIAAWAQGLAAQGITLTPASALALPAAQLGE